MNAEQYRALVNRLESINEAGELKIGDIDPRNGKKILSAMTDGSGNVVRSGTGEIWNVKYGEAEAPVADPVAPAVAEPVGEPAATQEFPLTPQEKCGPEVKEKIKAQKTFNAAYAMAKAAECPEFDWCQIVKVPGQGPSPTPPGGAGITTTNPMGDFDPTAFSGQAAAYEDIAESVGSDELDRVREIAGTQVVAEAGAIPEIKASSKAAAIAIAQKKGIKVFRFCGKYKVQAAKRQAPSPTPPGPKKPSGKVDFVGQASPLGGDSENPMSFASNSNFGA